MSERVIGVIGGSGVYEIDGLEGAEWRPVASPWGTPSDAILHGRLDGVEMRFLPRHGRGHRLSPSTINYRANIDAMKRAGATDLISVSACGSFREEAPPGAFVIVDQFIDRTFAREKSFFGDGLVGHVAFARPTCARLGETLGAACAAKGLAHRRGGTYLAMEGPQFSTYAESVLHRGWGADVVGMTNMPEAKLAREAELCYATVAMVTDYDSWRADAEEASVETIIAVLRDNAANARALIASAAPAAAASGGPPCPQGCDRALEYAIITAPEARDPAATARLDAVAGRVLNR